MTQINVDSFTTQPQAGKGKAASGPASAAGAFGAMVGRKLGLDAKKMGSDAGGSKGGCFQQAPDAEAMIIEDGTKGAETTTGTAVILKSDTKTAGSIQDLLAGEHVLTLSQMEELAACPEILLLAQSLANALPLEDFNLTDVPAESTATAGNEDAKENAGANAEPAVGATGAEGLKFVTRRTRGNQAVVAQADQKEGKAAAMEFSGSARNLTQNEEALKENFAEINAGETNGAAMADSMVQTAWTATGTGAAPANVSTVNPMVMQTVFDAGTVARVKPDAEQMTIPIESDLDVSHVAEDTGVNRVAIPAVSTEDKANSLEATAKMDAPEQNMPLTPVSNNKVAGETLANTRNAASGTAAETSAAVVAAAPAIIENDASKSRGASRENRSGSGVKDKLAGLQADKVDAKAALVHEASEVARGFAVPLAKTIEDDIAAVEHAETVTGVRSRQSGEARLGMFAGSERHGMNAEASTQSGTAIKANFAETLAADRTMRMADRVERLQDLVGRIDEHVLSMISDKGRSMTIQLTPENLGRVSLNCLENGKNISVEIVVENNAVRTLMQQQESALKDMLTQAGYRMTQFDVRSQSDGANSRHANRNPKNLPGKGRGPELANTVTSAVSETPVARPMGGAEQIWYIA